MSGEDDGVLEESGFIRVDREKALEKLSQYMLPSPELFLLPWARAAAAAGAGRLSVSGDSDIQMSFDGRPFGRGVLRDPYAALFAGSPDAALRHLAIGLLSCLATRPASVVIEAGPPQGRFRLVVKNPREESLEEAGPGGEGTVIGVRWALPARDRAAAAKAALRAAMAMTPSGFLVDGLRAGPRPKPSWPWACAQEDDRRVILRALVDPGGSVPRLTLCSFGVAVEELREEEAAEPVQAWVDDPSFALNASQAGIVRDGRFQEALEAVRRTARLLVTEGLTLFEQATVLAGDRAGLAAWLREAAFRHAWRKESDPVWDRLRAALLFEDCAGKTLGLRDMEAEFARSRRMLYAHRTFPGLALPWRVLHCPTSRDADGVRSMFGPDAVDVTRLLAGLPRA